MPQLDRVVRSGADTLSREQVALSSVAAVPRIAMISTHGYVAAEPPLGAADTGGQVVYVLELSKKLAELGYAVDIWTRRFEDQPEVEPVAPRVRIIRQPCGGREFIPKERLHEFLAEWNSNVLERIRKERLRYEFINSHYWDAGVAGETLSGVLGIPHVHTPHSLGIWKRRQMMADYPGDAAAFEAQYNFSQRIYEEHRIYASAAIVLPTTIPQSDLLVREYDVPSGKCHVLPAGFDETRFFPVSESRRRHVRQVLGFNRPVVLALGRLALNKGYDLLIRAFQLVIQRKPDALLHLAVGGAEMRGEQKRMLDSLKQLTAQLGLSDHVRLGTYIPDQDLADTYRAADVFVMPSRYEPFGMTALEAMACGTPTIITTHGGLRPVIEFGREALYADPFDREDLGIMMVKALNDQQLRERLSKLGARTARGSYTWSSIVKRLLATVERVKPVTRAVWVSEGSLN